MYRVGGVPEGTNPTGFGHSFLEDLEAFCIQLHTGEVCPARDVAPGARQARDEPTPHRICDKSDDDRYRRGRLLGGQRCWRRRGEENVNLEAYQVSRKLRESIPPSLGGSNLNAHVLAVDPTVFAKPSAKCRHVRRTGGRRSELKIAYPDCLRGQLCLSGGPGIEYAEHEHEDCRKRLTSNYEVKDLPARNRELKNQAVRFRNAMEVGPGGKPIQVEDPDGNPIELLEPAGR
jgi:hypothetical protein